MSEASNVEVGQEVLYDAGDERGIIRATVTKVREDGSLDLAYPHKRQDVAEGGVLMTGVEKARQGLGTFRWMLPEAVTGMGGPDEYDRWRLDAPAEPITLSNIVADNRIADLEAKIAEQSENIAGLEQAVRLALGLEPDASGDEVRAELEALTHAPDNDEDEDAADADPEKSTEPVVVDSDDDYPPPQDTGSRAGGRRRK